MRKVRQALLSLIFLLTGCVPQGGHHLPIGSPYRDPGTLREGEILHAETGRLLSQDELLDYLAGTPVVYVSESHDSVQDHAVQLAIIKGLHARFPGQVVIGMEMLQRPSQAEVDAYIRGEMEEKDFVRVWVRNWGDTFPYYRDILDYARSERMPILALNVARELRVAVSKHGLDQLPLDMQQELPEIDMDDPYYRARTEAFFAGHSQGSGKSEAFLRVQLLWDEVMAQTGADYLKSPAGRGKRLVVLAGGNHVLYGLGIPRRLFRRLPLPYTIVDAYHVRIAPEKERHLMQVELPALPLRPADFFWAVAYEDLPGPRVRLGVMVKEIDGPGVEVTEVAPGSPAERGGIRAGDVVVAMDGIPVHEGSDLIAQVSMHQPHDTGQVEVLRNGERLALTVTFSE